MRLRRLLRELRVRSHASVHVLVFAGGMCPGELGRGYRISAEENQVHTGYRRPEALAHNRGAQGRREAHRFQGQVPCWTISITRHPDPGVPTRLFR